MGTRGAFGFRLDNKDHVTYNHWDSYPEGLGQDMVDFLVAERTEHGDKLIASLSERVRALIPLAHDAKPTPLQIAALKEFTDKSVNGGRMDSFYCLLRKTQGKPDLFLKARYFEHGENFLLEGLFCEHAYVVNLDTGMLEYYAGFFQRIVGDDLPGRYWKPSLEQTDEDGSDDYGGVVLCAELPLSKMTPKGAKARVKEMERAYKAMRARYPDPNKKAA